MGNQYRERQEAYSQNKVRQAIERTRKLSTQAAKELEGYQEHMRARFKTKTMENYLTHLSKFICGSHNRKGKLTIKGTEKPLSQLTNADIKAFWRRIKDMSEGTKYATWQALRSYFCDYLKYDRQMDKNLQSKWEKLVEHIQKPVTTKRDLTTSDLVTADTVKQLVDACRNWRDKAFFTTLYETGARLSELLGMEVRDINFNSSPPEIKIKVSKTERKEGRRPVYIKDAVPILQRWLEEHPLNNGSQEFYHSSAPVWMTVIGEKREVMSPATARRIFELVRTRAKIPKDRLLFAHLFRHSAAQEWHSMGLDVKEIKELLGHTRIETTDGYLRVNKDVMLQKLIKGEKPKEWWKNKGLVEEKEKEIDKLRQEIKGMPQQIMELLKENPEDLRKALKIKGVGA